MKWKTKITELLGCKYPIISGAFAQYDNSDLVIAVSNAGAFGVLTASGFKNEDEFKKAIIKIKNGTTEPFGVNFSAGTEILPDHRFFKFLDILKQENINIVITASSKVNAFADKVRSYGMTWLHKVTTIQHAVSIEKLKPDAIIITGIEGAGLKNANQNTFLINMTNAANLLKTPFIASGGISTGKAMVAAFALGAQAIHIGTAFLATKESPAPEDVKETIVRQDPFDPEFIKQVCHIDFANGAPPYVLRSMACGTVNKIISAGELVHNIISEAEETIAKFCAMKDIADLIQS